MNGLGQFKSKKSDKFKKFQEAGMNPETGPLFKPLVVSEVEPLASLFPL